MAKMVRVGLSFTEKQIKVLQSECEKVGARVKLASLCYGLLCDAVPALKVALRDNDPRQLDLFGGGTRKPPRGARAKKKR